MLLVDSAVAGNVFDDEKYGSLDRAEYLRISRADMERARIRGVTDEGTDVGLVLEARAALRNGDVFEHRDKTIVIRQIPEKVISVRLRHKDDANLFVLTGHIIGNRHRPISVEGDTVFFPIQADSELEVFQRLFSGVAGRVELGIQERIFTPQKGADVHGHA